MKKLLINILCAFVPGRHNRGMLRIRLNYPIRKWTRFAKSCSRAKHPRVRYTCGFRCINFVVNIDDKYVFKFPLVGDGRAIALREQRITDALRPISPIKIPNMKILDYDGMAVRRYDCVRGIGFHSMDHKTQNSVADHIAKQLAQFLYIVGMADPIEIRDLKPKRSVGPGIMHGWNQNDLWDNFIMNPKTFDIVAVIDWEQAGFGDFYDCFTHGTKNAVVKNALLREYLKLYFGK